MIKGRFLKFKDVAGEYRFNLQSANNKIIMKGSEGYSSSAACDKGIASVRVNSQIDQRYKKKTMSNGEYMFTLIAGNYEPIGVSEGYNTSAGRDEGINDVKRIAPDAPVADQT